MRAEGGRTEGEGRRAAGRLGGISGGVGCRRGVSARAGHEPRCAAAARRQRGSPAGRTFSEARGPSASLACMEATVPRWVLPSASWWNSVVLPALHGPTSSTTLPLGPASHSLSRAAGRRGGGQRRGGGGGGSSGGHALEQQQRCQGSALRRVQSSRCRGRAGVQNLLQAAQAHPAPTAQLPEPPAESGCRSCPGPEPPPPPS